jgi:uncharacterized membrane protein
MTATRGGGGRLREIDILRGLVMVVMTIDHAREYSAGPGGLGDPMDLAAVSPLLFGMRWISHFCAPVFVFLMGVSAYLSVARRPLAEASRQMAIRGCLLLAIEFTVVAWAWTFNPLWPRQFFQVIGAIGVAMVALAAALRWSRGWQAGVGLAICLGHNAFDSVRFSSGTAAHYVWSFLHQRNVLPLGGGFEVRTTYPVLPIVGLALLGYAAGPWFRGLSAEAAKRVLFRAGLLACAVFLALRLTNSYGDASRFQVQSDWLFTLFSLGNATKYPLSLHFMLMTVGPALLFLGWAHGRSFSRTAWLETLGRTPMFYYIAHLWTLHALAWAAALLGGYPLHSFDVSARFGGMPEGFGFPLWATLPFSFLTTALLLPACGWYAERRKRSAWLRLL